MNLEEAADQLYGCKLDDFVSERARLVSNSVQSG